MILAWVWYGLIVSVLLSCGALALERVCRMREWPTRWIWAAALVAPLLLAIVADPAPDARSLAKPALAAARAELRIGPAAPPIASQERASLGEVLLGIRQDVAQGVRELQRSAELDRALMAAWLTASVLLLIVMTAGWLRLQIKAASWRTREVAGSKVLVSNDVGPAVLGLFRPRIVVPIWLLHADHRTQSAALAHERQHIAAGDPQLLLAAAVLLVLLPWNLPLWWQWRRLKLAIEVDCDARVLRAGLEIEEYGAALLQVAEHRSEVPMLSPTMHESASMLEKRIRLMLAPNSIRQTWLAAGLILLATSMGTAATQINTPPANDIEAASGLQSRERSAGRALGRELVDAVRHGNFDTAVALLDAGADVNELVRGDGTPLIIAARRGHSKLVQLLLQRGADVNLAASRDGSPLIAAAARGHRDIASMLVESGADVNGFVMYDETPLINAARHGHLDVVQYLVDKGADVNLSVPADRERSARIRSPLSVANEHGHRSVVRYLLEHGARS